MSAVKIRRPYFRLQVVIVGRKQKRARPVIRYVVGVFGKDVLPVAFKVFPPPSAKRESQSLSTEKRRRFNLPDIREVWIRAQAGPRRQWSIGIPDAKEMHAMQKRIFEREPAPSPYFLLDSGTCLYQVRRLGVGRQAHDARRSGC